MSVVETLRRLSEARDRGDLSTEEFERRRAHVLDTVDVADVAEERPSVAARAPGTGRGRLRRWRGRNRDMTRCSNRA